MFLGGWQSGQLHCAVDAAAERPTGVRIPHHPLVSEQNMLKKIGAKWYVLSEKTKKSLGDYSTKKDAKKRLGQVEFFKRLKQTRGIKEGRKGRQ